jgi:hypothetical protein
MHRSLPAAIATSAAALVLAAAAPAASPPASGKVDAASPAASGSQHLRNAGRTGAECPNGLACRVVPAAYQQNSADPGDYGNYDLATRPSDGLAIRYVVIHDTEYGYDPTIALFQNPLAYVSAHYVIRSADGQVTQMVPTQDVACRQLVGERATRSVSRTRASRPRATSGTRTRCTARSRG